MLAVIFEWLPTIKEARSYISPENFDNHGISCHALLQARAWYGKVNQWFWAWIILTPAIIFSISPHASASTRGGILNVATVVCYGLMNAAVYLEWDIRNAPFSVYRSDCANVGDGLSRMLALFLGWIPALCYVWGCSYVWILYHRMFSKQIMESYSRDAVTCIFSVAVKVYTAVTVVFILLMVAHSKGVIDAKPISWIYYLILRPLFIPFEIFWY